MTSQELPQPKRKVSWPSKDQKDQKKTYNSWNMALLTQVTAALILVASRHGVKRSTPPRIPWNMASHPELGASKTRKIRRAGFLFFLFFFSLKSKY
jgi:hypothetical protein